ncbi:MAG TPA: histidine kinase dimerization/phospho-acceptor domain-containing protein [Candidatus Nitrosocosmicus sp.]
MNEKLEMVNDKLKNQDKILNEFIHIAAHGLKNPIQPILGLSQFLRSKIIQKQEEQINTDDVSSILNIIILNAKKMNSLTDNVLDIAKIEAKSFNLKRDI